MKKKYLESLSFVVLYPLALALRFMYKMYIKAKKFFNKSYHFKFDVYAKYGKISIVALVVLCALVGIIMLTSVFSATTAVNTYRTENRQEIVYVVERGDTLWSIASEYHPDFMDIRKYIDIIVDDNELSGYLQPGTQLVLYTY